LPDWGEVPVNGIPPLTSPKHIPAGEAKCLQDDHGKVGVTSMVIFLPSASNGRVEEEDSKAT
jgi:hypothetical protein